MLDITGCDHLFDGEAAMLADVTGRMHGLGYSARAAIAPTPGVAWALSRYAETGAITGDFTDLPAKLSPCQSRPYACRPTMWPGWRKWDCARYETCWTCRARRWPNTLANGGSAGPGPLLAIFRNGHPPFCQHCAIPPPRSQRPNRPPYSSAEAPSRPLRLLPEPEPVHATALLPDHPPAAFRWHKVMHRVSQGGGPERIAPEWWRNLSAEEPSAALDDTITWWKTTPGNASGSTARASTTGQSGKPRSRKPPHRPPGSCKGSWPDTARPKPASQPIYHPTGERLWPPSPSATWTTPSSNA